MKIYDVIIVGAGPAGLMAARTLDRLSKDIDFLVFDSKKEVGKPICCGEAVKKHVLQRVLRPFLKKEDYYENNFEKLDFIRNTCEYEVDYRGYKRKISIPYYKFDRTKFEKWLAEPITHNIKLKTKVIDVKTIRKYAEVRIKSGNKEKTYLSKLVLLCNGCNYELQKKLGLAKDYPKRLGICYGGVYRNCKFDDNEEKTLKYIGYEKIQGYYWIFPNSKTEANVGVGVIRSLNVKKLLEEFVKNNKSLKNSKKVVEFAGCDPLSGTIEKTYGNRALACGDAAGFVYAGTGEGICYALESGRIAANVAHDSLRNQKYDNVFLKRYEQLWKRSFGRQLKGGLIFFDFQLFAYLINKMHGLMRQPSETELENMILEGRFPLRAVIGHKILKATGCFNEKSAFRDRILVPCYDMIKGKR